MEPYNPNKPFISMKLDGSLLDRMVEAGIPFSRALQYFRDNPEGSAFETLKTAAEDVVPFYGNYRNGGDLSDYAKEAVMLAMPTPKGGRMVVPDVTETRMFNDKLKQIAATERNKGSSYVADKLDDWSNRNLTLDDYKLFENWSNPYYYDNVPGLSNDKYINSKRNDVVLTEGDMNNPVLDRQTAGFIVDKHGTPPRISHEFTENLPVINDIYTVNSLKPEILKAKEAYEGHGGIDRMVNDLIDYFTYDKYPINNSKRSNYAFTIGDLERERIPGKSETINDVNRLLGDPNYSTAIDMYARNFGKSYQDVKDIFSRINNALADPTMSRSDKYITIKSALEELSLEEALLR